LTIDPFILKGFFIACALHILLKAQSVKGFHKISYWGTRFEITLAQTSLPKELFQNPKHFNMLLTIVLLIACIVLFSIFFKSIDFFEKI